MKTIEQWFNEHVTKYYNDMANGYEPNISLYINDRR